MLICIFLDELSNFILYGHCFIWYTKLLMEMHIVVTCSEALLQKVSSPSLSHNKVPSCACLLGRAQHVV